MENSNVDDDAILDEIFGDSSSGQGGRGVGDGGALDLDLDMGLNSDLGETEVPDAVRIDIDGLGPRRLGCWRFR